MQFTHVYQERSGNNCGVFLKRYLRGGGSTGAAGAFAPVNFQQRVHCTRPDEELPYKWLYFSLKMSFWVHKRAFWVQKGASWCKNVVQFWIFGMWDHPFTLKKFYALVLSGPWRRPCYGCLNAHLIYILCLWYDLLFSLIILENF